MPQLATPTECANTTATVNMTLMKTHIRIHTNRINEEHLWQGVCDDSLQDDRKKQGSMASDPAFTVSKWFPILLT